MQLPLRPSGLLDGWSNRVRDQWCLEQSMEGKSSILARIYLKEKLYFSYKHIPTRYLFSKLLLHLFKRSVDFVSTPLWVSFDAELWNTMIPIINTFYILYTSVEVWGKDNIQREVLYLRVEGRGRIWQRRGLRCSGCCLARRKLSSASSSRLLWCPGDQSLTPAAKREHVINDHNY